MMKKLIYTCTFISCLLFLMGCADDFLSGLYKGDGVQLTINLEVPGESSAATRAIKSRVGGTNDHYNGLDPNTEYQRYIADGDLYILVFENTSSGTGDESWQLMAVPTITNIGGTNGDATREITALMSRVSGSKTLLVDVVANLAENGVTLNQSSTIDFSDMIGQSRETIYESLSTFAYPTNSDTNPYGVWSLETTDATSGTTTHRYLPMWGQSSTATTGGRMTYTVDGNTTELEVHCGLYRSVAKMGVLVDSGCETFQLKEIYVYYPNSDGTFVSLPIENGEDANWSPSIYTQYTLPEVPSSATARDIAYPLVYKMSTPISAGNSYLNQIYVTEADNKNNSTNPVCLVVGGYYLGGDYNGEGLVDGTSQTDQYTLNYYRIDLESLTTSEGSTAATGPFDVIRNHSYLFNIKNANNPGTSDPDPRSAASGLEVEILDYVDVPMYGINSQYTLTVNKSLFSFEGATTSVGQLLVSTDGTEWELVTNWNEMEGFPQSEEDPDQTGYGTTANELPDWAHVTDLAEGAHTNVNDTVLIEVDANVNNELLKNGSFWVRAGQIIKRIDIVQDYVETANSYLITAAGTYDAKVNIRGNGNTTAWTNDTGTTTEEIDFGLTDSISDVVYLEIIWETADGLVTIPADQTLSESGCLSYEVHNVSLDTYGDWTGNALDPGNGGNALIGVYNSKNELVWSFHVWVCGDYANGVLTEPWVVGSSASNLSTYNFMDRNLGAYSNLPGSKSFGLLYQWGRKDPFIGAWREATSGTYEQDFRRVRKQYTRHYPQQNDTTYVWGNYNDANVAEATDIVYAIKHPTTILDEGLLNTDHESGTTQTQAQGLWGTADYNADANELGNKTMYDPCPAGYRVPSLNALTIWDGYNNLWYDGQAQHSSFSCRFVPVPSGEGYTNTDYRTGNGHGADFVSGAPFYGFWLDYDNQYHFNSTVTEDTSQGGPGGTTTYVLGENAYGVVYYNAATVADGTYGWLTNSSGAALVGQSPDHVTWIPMAGIYNGTMESFGRAGLTDQSPGGNEPYLPASSLEVTSVLWANSPTQNNSNYPGGLLVHGTEGAYAPHYTSGQGQAQTTVSYNYSSGTPPETTGTTTSTGTPGSVATEGKGYWTTESGGSSTIASGWWTGSVDAKKSSMDPNIENGQWNGVSEITSYNSWSDEDGFSESGRHFHSYIESNASVYANPSYAASVRCIRDKDAIVHKDDKLYLEDGKTEYDGTTLYLYDFDESGESNDIISLVISYVEEWEVTYPGAKWISISPTSGSTTDPSGSIDAITITCGDEKYMPSPTDAVENRTAYITITTARGTTFTITVVYVGGNRVES